MNLRIIAVHGIGQYTNGAVEDITAQLSATYTLAFGRDIHAVYYAHLLRDPTQQTAPAQKLTADETAILYHWARAFGVPEETTQGYTTFPIRLIADWIARTIAHTDDDATIRTIARLLTNFARDAAAYLNHPDQRTAVQQHLTTAIAKHKPDVIIAHSLGTVVTYETLWANPHLHVPLLITAGSPLAMPGAIFDRLQPPPQPQAHQGHGTKPPNTDRWINIADPGDLVAIPRPLNHRFHGLHPADDHTASIGTLALHSFTRYLKTRRLHDCLPE